MKKSLYLCIIAVLATVLVACGEDNASEHEQPVEPTEEETVDENEAVVEEQNGETEEDQSIEVEKGLLNVSVTIPSTLIEEQDLDQIIAEAKEAGVKEVTQNDDGSITYKMSKATHKEMMQEMEAAMNETIEEMKYSDDFISIADVKSNHSFTEFTMVVDKEAYENSFDGFAALGLGFSGMYYQLFDGVNPDNLKVTIHLEDADTGEVFDTIVFPDAFEE
ncbi:hypothetical protein BTR23_11260 [Alkalihalophilus pseudofirmus]|nr:hypothetical protein BTR23_11260 [Alkalihalophilus pseudofirmus]